jgi:hypothetical protein
MDTLDTLVSDFETVFPGWGWLVRNAKGTAKLPDQYFCHLMSPQFQGHFLVDRGDRLVATGSSGMSFQGHGPTAASAFRAAMDQAMERGR